MIIDLQRGIAEAGRIRIGIQVPIPSRPGKTRPEKLATFRLTSPDRRRIEEAAVLFGGEVTPWDAPAGKQWQVITATAELDVIVPPQAMAFSQHYEMWSAGGCQRRCDGQTESLSEQACLCDPEERGRSKDACDIHTRLSLMIRDLPGLALWRLDTQGWYAARELAGAVEVLALAAGRGVLLPARLLLEQRSVKRADEHGKPQTMRFAVPRLDLGITPGELLLSGAPAGIPMAALTDGAPPERRLTPVPQIEGPRPTIAEQSAPPAPPAPRRNAAPEIPSSGRSRQAPRLSPGAEGYWRSRAFAEGAARAIDADRMREIAAARAGESIDGFSMSAVDEAGWEQIHRTVLGFPLMEPPADHAPLPTPPADVPASAPETAPAAPSTPKGYPGFRARFMAAEVADRPTKAAISDMAIKQTTIPDLALHDIREWPLNDTQWTRLANGLGLPAVVA